MTAPSTALQQAMQLIGEDPLPADVEARLEALERQAPATEAEKFGDLWEALIAAGVPLTPHPPAGQS